MEALRERWAALTRGHNRPASGRPAPAMARGGWYRREQAIMGTAVTLELWADSPTQAEAATAAVMAEMHRIDRAMSPFKPESELSRINRDAGERAVPLSAEMCTLIARALHFSDLSAGAFDISYAAVGHLFDYRQGVRPDEQQLAQARECVGWRMLQLDEHAGTLRFARKGMRIDLGGFAKGHAVDNAARLLQGHGIAHAIVSAGGDSRVLGDRRGRPWTIGIRHPRREGESIAVLPLEDVAVSTSGDYERYFDQGGVRWHHLLDPRTGLPPQQVHSVTVLAPDGLTSEALSKTVFVLGPEQGLRVAARVPGVDVVVVDARGRLHCSEGLR